MSSRFPRNLNQLMGAARRIKRAFSPLLEQTRYADPHAGRKRTGPKNTDQKSADQTMKPRRGPAKRQSGGECAADEQLRDGYPGDFVGSARLEYSPKHDGKPDPGEIVWTWVPYEEDHCKGKDRPVLLVGRNGDYLLAAMLTTRDRNNAHEHDPNYLDIGTGPWDVKRRPSEVKLDRIIQVDPQDVRRNGAILDEARFRQVQAHLEHNLGWRQ